MIVDLTHYRVTGQRKDFRDEPCRDVPEWRWKQIETAELTDVFTYERFRAGDALLKAAFMDTYFADPI